MTHTPTIQNTLSPYEDEILAALRHAMQQASAVGIQAASDLEAYYGQMQYHLGWVDASFSPVKSHPGKLLRPTLVLFAYEAAGAGGLSDDAPSPDNYLQRALPAAVAVELVHNFSLIHDDIVDRDEERRHRATLWKLWGMPQGINTGDGMFALARLALWDMVDKGVEAATAVQLGAALDRTCLMISEGQYLDLLFESRQDVSVSMYVDMIGRKTAALIGCAAEMGALLGTRDQETIERLRSFGYAMGLAFQVRDDLLGVWASAEESGKTPAGDIYRRKKSLPVLHALEHASPKDQQFLHQLYQQASPLTEEQVAAVLAVFARTHTQAHCRSFLAEQCRLAHEALANVPRTSSPVATRALENMQALVHFVEAAAKM